MRRWWTEETSTLATALRLKPERLPDNRKTGQSRHARADGHPPKSSVFLDSDFAEVDNEPVFKDALAAIR